MDKYDENVDIFELYNEKSVFKISKKLGVLPISWLFESNEILFVPEHFQNQIGKRLFGIPLMYPFANRISYNVLPISGISCKNLDELDNNLLKDVNGNIMHGLLLMQDLWKFKSKIGTHQLSFELLWNRDFDLFPYFPIEHRVELSYILINNSVQVHMIIENYDQIKLPLSYGFHPYFLIDRQFDSSHKIKIPALDLYETNEQLFPTGKLIPVQTLFEPNQAIGLDAAKLDTCFTNLILNSEGQVEILLETNNYDLLQKMDAVYKNLIVYKPEDLQKPYICIEPMIAATNAFHDNFESLPKIEKGQIHHAVFEITIKNKFGS